MSEIGLKKGTVKLKKHNLQWKKLFEQETKVLLGKFSDIILEISHGGSTAIPKIPAKPIIDMFAAVSSLRKTETIKKELERLGYEHYGEDGVNGRILYIKGGPKISTYHLQFVQKNNNEWKNHLLIKNYFLKYPKVAEKYAELKIELSKKFPNDRKSYTNGKDAFIKSIIKRAKARI